MMISKLFTRYSRRQLHTIVSRDLIKPSSPTPSNRKTYNLSLLDQLSVNAYVPVVTIFPSSATDHQSPDSKTTELKHSLSQTLTKYYPFAGRMSRIGQTFVDCNDKGVEFIEAKNDSSLSDFLRHFDHKDLDQLCPDDLIWYNRNRRVKDDENDMTSPVAGAQITHFACGAVAVAASVTHKVGDASSTFNFVNDWATVTRSKNKDASDINPHFVTNYEPRNVKVPEILPEREEGIDCVTRSFVFPNSKKNDLKAMAMKMATEFGQPITNPTFAECLTWLLHKCATAAATKANSGIFEPSGLGTIMNMRSNFNEPLPDTAIGNFYQMMDFPTSNESEMTPNAIIGELRKKKTEVRRIKSLESMLGMIAEAYSEAGMVERLKQLDQYYVYSFLNRFPAYGIDFGWGSPVKVSVAGTNKRVTLFLASPDEDGIEALVCLERREMEIFQNDPMLLAFC
ncbi:hypothetical protein OSB04_010039 [Centaurea solstitialis]|uniref:Transferase, Chloramphenicol acetyltransferase-like domain protein n=1 Tax=Centaurea solstitialis TaxID=347529 RepID=A0AA38WK92_9ASTR|nr:hypothetical protein OSB04_010039 [Centaurea solstitialis]